MVIRVWGMFQGHVGKFLETVNPLAAWNHSVGFFVLFNFLERWTSCTSPRRKSGSLFRHLPIDNFFGHVSLYSSDELFSTMAIRNSVVKTSFHGRGTKNTSCCRNSESFILSVSFIKVISLQKQKHLEITCSCSKLPKAKFSLQSFGWCRFFHQPLKFKTSTFFGPINSVNSPRVCNQKLAFRPTPGSWNQGCLYRMSPPSTGLPGGQTSPETNIYSLWK